jgi:hypothetical protein
MSTTIPASPGDSTPVEPTPLLLDAVQGSYDESIAAHVIVDATPARTFRGARELDFLTIHTPLLAASFFLRDLPARLLGRPRPAAPPQMRLVGGTGLDLPGWMVVAEQPDREIVFGAVGRFWTPTIEWNAQVDPTQFATFSEPGWGVIACNFAVMPYGDHRTLLTYECRTRITDALSRPKFERYWWLVRPFVAHILRATVSTIRADAQGQSGTHDWLSGSSHQGGR